MENIETFYKDKIKNYALFEESVKYLDEITKKLDSNYIYKLIDSINISNRTQIIEKLKTFKINRVKIDFHIKYILKYIFEDITENEIFIPLSFAKTEIGTLLLKAYKLDNEILISLKDASKILGCTRQNMHYLSKNKIPNKKIGTSIFFKLSDIMAYIDEEDKND